MGIFKRFNREQLTLGVAGFLGALLFGWQIARGGAEAGSGPLPATDRVYAIPRRASIEFVDSKVDRYLGGRDIWEPPAAGRLPIPEIRPPEPKLGQMVLPPLAPRPDFTQFNLVPIPGKFRTIASAAQGAAPAGFPSDADIAALKDLKEPESGGKLDLRKQLMRPDGLSVVHRLGDLPPLVGKIILEVDQTSDGSMVIEEVKGTGTAKTSVRPADINKEKPGTDEGVERGGEYGKEYLRRAKKLADDDAEGHRRLGEWCRENAGMLPESRAEMQTAAAALRKRGEAGPKMRDAVLYLVEVLRDSGAYDEAIAALQDYIDAVKGTPNETAELHMRGGQLYAQLGFHERSLISFTTASQLDPGKAPPRIAMARARLNLGETKYALDEIDALLVAGGPPDPEALVVQGLARLHVGLAAAAEDAFKASLAARPGHGEALNGLGVAQALQQKPEAPAGFLAAIRANQYQIDAWLNLGLLYLAAGRPVEAETLFAGAFQRDPDSAIAAAGPAFAALLKGAHAEAAAAFERARKIHPDDYWLAYALGRLKLRAGKPKEALELFQASLRSNPDFLPSTTDAALAFLALAREEQRLASLAPADRQAPIRERAGLYRIRAEMLLEAAYVSDPNSLAANAALGCVYAVMGRTREANAAFDRATVAGKADPLLDYGRGYVEFWYGADSPKQRLDLAEIRFKYGAAHPATDPADLEWVKECSLAMQAIEDWRNQRIHLEDRFDGGRPSPTASWIPVNANPGPQVRFEKDMVVIGVTEAKSPSSAFAALEHRDIPREGFLSVEATLVLEESAGFEAGFSLYTDTPKGVGMSTSATGLHFVFLEDMGATGPRPIRVFYGQILAARDKGPSRPNLQLGTLPAAPGRIRFKVERRTDPQQPNAWIFDFSVWDDAKGTWRMLTTELNPIRVAPSMASSPVMMMQFWGRALAENRKWSVGLDDVRVLVVEKP